MSPVPAGAICRGCHGDLFRTWSGWHHVNADDVGLGHDIEPMDPEERREYEDRIRDLVAKYVVPRPANFDSFPIVNVASPKETDQ